MGEAEPIADRRGRRRGRPEAAEIIWHRHAAEPERTESPARRRTRGVLQGLGAAIVGALVLLYWSRWVALVILTTACVLFFSALISPTVLYAAVERFFLWLGRVTGTALTWVLLPAIFFLVFLPYGLAFRRGGNDRMTPLPDPDAPSYWETRDPEVRHSHLRQY